MIFEGGMGDYQPFEERLVDPVLRRLEELKAAGKDPTVFEVYVDATGTDGKPVQVPVRVHQEQGKVKSWNLIADEMPRGTEP